MKIRPSILLALSFVGIITYSSCTKKYICHCNIVYTGAPGLPDSTSKEFDVTDTKSKAKSTCEKESGTYNNNSIKSVETCYLY